MTYVAQLRLQQITETRRIDFMKVKTERVCVEAWKNLKSLMFFHDKKPPLKWFRGGYPPKELGRNLTTSKHFGDFDELQRLLV